MLRKLFLTCQIQASRDLKLDKLCSDYHSDKVVKVVVATLRKSSQTEENRLQHT